MRDGGSGKREEGSAFPSAAGSRPQSKQPFPLPPSPSPPRLWRHVLGTALPTRDRAHLVRELDELYGARVRDWGRSAARQWYRGEVLGYVGAIHVLGVESAARRTVKRLWEGAVGDLWRDIRRAGRSLVRNPGFTAVAMLTLTLGIGANTVIFSVVDHVALRPLPYDRPGELVRVWPDFWMVRGELDIMTRESQTLASVGGFVHLDGFNLATTDGSRRVSGNAVAPALLETLGVQPFLGRNFQPEESQPGAGAVALLSYELWRSQYGAESGVVGQTVLLDGRAHLVVGVLPPGFAYPSPNQDVLIPLFMDPANPGEFWGYGGHAAVARLAPGATAEAAAAELRALAERMREANPLWTPNPGYRDNATVIPMQDAMVGDVQPTLLILLGAVGLVLLVACANVANLLLARGLARGRDVALRAALGASRGRLLREHLVESLLLAIGGSVVAMVLAQWTLGGVVALLPPEIPRAGEIALDIRVIAAGIAFALTTGVVAGVVPAMRGSATDPGTILREGGRGTNDRSRRRLSSTMVVAQVAVAVVLVTDAGLLVRSLARLGRVDTGFVTQNVSMGRVTLTGANYSDAAGRYAFYQNVVDRLQAIPGVEEASIGRRAPFGPGAGGIATFIEGVTDDPNALPVLQRNQIMPGYLETLGVPLVQGRMIQSTDDDNAPLVAVVDETTAQEFWPGESPLGHRIRYPWRGAPWIEVVGVVGGIADGDLSVARQPTFYVPMAQGVTQDATIIVRSSVSAELAATAIGDVVGEVDDRIPVSGLAPIGDLVGRSLAQARWTAFMLSLFAGATLLLGCVGVYGVIAYSVRARTQEIGVRMALGAGRDRIRRAVLGDGLVLAVPGTMVGMALAVPGARILEGLLFGVSTLDPVTFAVTPIVLLAAAVLAVYLPARRATTVDPVEALRGGE